jgi:hypothetical protein
MSAVVISMALSLRSWQVLVNYLAYPCSQRSQAAGNPSQSSCQHRYLDLDSSSVGLGVLRCQAPGPRDRLEHGPAWVGH